MTVKPFSTVKPVSATVLPIRSEFSGIRICATNRRSFWSGNIEDSDSRFGRRNGPRIAV